MAGGVGLDKGLFRGFALDICRHLVVSRTTTARSRPGPAVGFSHGQGVEYMGIIGDGFIVCPPPRHVVRRRRSRKPLGTDGVWYPLVMDLLLSAKSFRGYGPGL